MASPNRSSSSRSNPPSSAAQVDKFIDGLVSHAVLDGGDLVVAHAGLPESMHGRASNAVRSFALYGDTTGETDEFGLPVRYPWADDYRGRAAVVYGHTPGARSGLGQRHHLHRHRLRVRRQAHRAPLAGARARVGPRRRDLLRADETADAGRSRPESPATSTSTT